MNGLKIGELAAACGCGAETVRYYEREGLLSAAARSDGNYRLYGPEQIHRLTFIRHCRSLDMTLDEIRRLLHFGDAPEDSCEEINELLDTHIVQIAARMTQLQDLQRQLSALRSLCNENQAVKNCGILKGLRLAGGQ